MTTTTTPTDAIRSNNPFLQQDGLPKFASVKTEHLVPAVDFLLAQMETNLTSLETELTNATTSNTIVYDDVLPNVERLSFALHYCWGMAGHLNAVKNSDALRVAYETCQPKIVAATTKVSQSKPLYEALLQVQSTFDPTDASFEASQRRRAVELSLRDMTLGGVGLDGEAKERFNEIKTRLAQLKTTFNNNVLDETKAFGITVSSSEDGALMMDKVPSSAKEMWAQAHARYLKKEQAESAASSTSNDGESKETEISVDPNTGPWRLTLDAPSFMATMAHLPDRRLREELYRGYITRASEKSSNPDKNNVTVIQEILALRTETAALLGFGSYAKLSLESKMAPSVERVRELTDLIAQKALPFAERDLAEITALARVKGGSEYSESNLAKLEPWDVSFWKERLKEGKFEITEEETRPYFALPAVLSGMFKLVGRIFGVSVEKADGEAEVWHPDVQFFKMYDNTTSSSDDTKKKRHVASFYLDPYSRPENKRGGAWFNECISKSEATGRSVPVAYLTCNGTNPVMGNNAKPSLMTFNEVETLFHEFGHGLQHMLTTASVGDVSGINGVEWDAVELPSQFMENWCYDRPTVYGFAKHWETNDPLPEEMFEKLKRQKTFCSGMGYCRQLYFGQLDMELYANYTGEEEKESIFDVQRRMATKYTPYQLPLPDDRFLCAFAHIFAGGYAAGYYSYVWAEVMSADAFSAFEDVGLDHEEEICKVGRRFRETVLSLGGGKAPSEVFRSFRGRDPTPDALLRHNGLA